MTGHDNVTLGNSPYVTSGYENVRIGNIKPEKSFEEEVQHALGNIYKEVFRRNYECTTQIEMIKIDFEKNQKKIKKIITQLILFVGLGFLALFLMVVMR